MSEADRFIRDLVELETPKTWSLIVTAFGDLEGESLPGKEIGALMALAGLRPEATRVALHRLRNDGWITSERAGREVTYTLSPRARSESQAAAGDIYRRTPKHPESWRLFALSPDAGGPPPGALSLSRGVIALPVGADAGAEAIELMARGDTLPRWAEERLVPAHLLDQAQALSGLVARHHAAAHDLDKTQMITSRLMFVHYWRRLALRPGTWAHIALMPGGAVASAHSSVTDLLARSPRVRPVSHMLPKKK